MKRKFIGRKQQLDLLTAELKLVSEGQGRFVTLRGRRRIGKSRLVEEFLSRQDVPHAFLQASRRDNATELRRLERAVARSSLPLAEQVRAGLRFDSWEVALQQVAETARHSGPCAFVLDELPYRLEVDMAFDSELQAVWDQHLQNAPVLLIAIGSDISMMDGLTAHGSALHGRPTREIVVPPLSPAETAALLELDGAEAFDAYLVVGGFPQVIQTWAPGTSRERFLRSALGDPTSELIVNGERILNAEFRPEVQAREVLSAIGHGERTFSGIQRAMDAPPSSMQRSLETLVDAKRLVAAELPLSAKRSRARRYSIADPQLRFWLRFIEPHLPEIERGRADIPLEDIRGSWTSYRGKAVEPLVREALSRALPDESRFGDARYVGGYWTRTGDVEVDLVGAPEREQPRHISFAGSIKWRERAPFDQRDVRELSRLASLVPGSDERTPLVGVSRSGFAAKTELDVALSPDDLLAHFSE